ncbi:MAG: T9SS type A sorting domain-containing protein [Candidatus Aegiribacteria sp.]|nr:T9SS type A sorting domain-containing protein [Candidatus Aegiribacteria sp.]
MYNILYIFLTALTATTYIVPSDYTTIQEAIDASVDGDSILVLPGDYLGFNYLGKNVHVESTDGPDSTRIMTWIDFLTSEGRGAVLKGFEVSAPVGYEQYALVVEGASPSIIGNVFLDHLWLYSGVMYEDAKNGGVIKITNSSALLEGNTFLKNRIGWDSYYGGGDYSICRGLCVYVDNSGSLACVEMRNNTFYNNTAVTYGVYFYGLCVYVKGKVVIENNLFYNNGFTSNSFFTCKGNALCVETYSDVDVTNCTFNHNYIFPDALHMRSIAILDSTSCNISCSIVWDDIIFDPYDQISVEYSNVENGWPGTGNIDEDPLFFSGGLSPYHLTPSSNCIDGGNPDPVYNDPEDPGNPGFALWPALGDLRNDMGVYGGPGAIYWSETGTGIGEYSLPDQHGLPIMLGIYPNPTSHPPIVTLTLAENNDVELSIFDLTGRLILSPIQGEFSQGVYQVQLAELTPGIYFCRIVSGDYSTSQRFVVIQ